MNKLLFLNLCLFFAVGCSSSEEQGSQADTVHHRVDVETFKAKMQEEGVVILDVRTPAETRRGKIEGAIELDYKTAGFEKGLETLDKDKTYLVYCQGGGRSNKACKKMEALGFKDLYDLETGYRGWSKANAK